MGGADTAPIRRRLPTAAGRPPARISTADRRRVVRHHPGRLPIARIHGTRCLGACSAKAAAPAVDAMRLGVADYLLKDAMPRLPQVIARAIEVHEARRARERAVAELAISERRLAELAEHLQTSIEQERAAIAREIH